MKPLVLAGLLWSALASAALEVKVVLPEQGVDDKLKAFLEGWKAGRTHDPRSEMEQFT